MSSFANKKKNEALGENYATASNKLKKLIMFDLIQRLDLDWCYRCGNKLTEVSNLSVEHKDAWMAAENPKESFYDLDNIAFSHLGCNVGARRTSPKKRFNYTHCPRGHSYEEHGYKTPRGTTYCKICNNKRPRQKLPRVGRVG